MADGKADPLPKHLPAIPVRRTPWIRQEMQSCRSTRYPVTSPDPVRRRFKRSKGARSHIDPTDPDQIEEPGFDARQPDHLDLRGWWETVEGGAGGIPSGGSPTMPWKDHPERGRRERGQTGLTICHDVSGRATKLS